MADGSKKRPRGDLLASLDAAFAAKPAASASKYTAQAAQVQAQANSQQAYLHTKRKKKNSSKGATLSNGAGRGVGAGSKSASNGVQQHASSSSDGAKQVNVAKRPQDPLYGKLDVDVLRVGLKNCSLLPQVKTLQRQYVLSATLKSFLDTATETGGKSVAAAAEKLKNKVLQLDNPVRTADKNKNALNNAQAQTAKLLSARQRRELGFHLLKGEMLFSDAEKLCAIWRRYVRDAIGLNELDLADEIARNLRVQAKLKVVDLSGCPVEVVSSQNPLLVGVSGIVIAEKQQVLQLCTPSNRIITLPKLSSRFRVALSSDRAILVKGEWLLQRNKETK